MRLGSSISMRNFINYYIYSLCIFTIVFSAGDIATNKYYHRIWGKKSAEDKIKLVALLIIHNLVYFTIYFTVIFVIFGYFTKVYGNKRKDLTVFSILTGIYFLYMAGTLLHWKSNDNKCELTDMQNKLLEISEDHGFRDWYAIIFNKYPVVVDGGFRSNLYYAAIICSALVSLFILLRLLPRLLK